MLAALFWLALLTLVYTFVGYPALVWCVARLRPRSVRRADIAPTVSVLIAAHNEAATIRARIMNCLALDYPLDRLEIVVASDGSTDGTAEIARRHEQGQHPGPAVRVISYASRRGKPSVLNDTVPQCRGEVVVLADARQQYARDAVRRLTENFADPAVGAASGELSLVNETGVAVGDAIGAYWRYEKLIRRAESQLDSTIGATGAIYAIRRTLFAPIPTDTLLDDVLIPVRIARRGFRVIFDGRARAWDATCRSARQEYLRKVRTIAGVAQLFARERWLLAPVHRLWIQAVSHKFLRLAAPYLMLLALTCSVLLAHRSTFHSIILAAQFAFYAVALVGALLRAGRGPVARFLALPYAFCLLNFTTIIAISTLVMGKQSVRWRRGEETPVAAV